MRRLILVFFILLLVPFVFAKQGHMKLLAVKEVSNGYEGSSADLYLEIKPGNGRVFLDTFPLTKTDTQISTRYARDVACDYLDVDCNGHDFFYTINADSSIIGGPSAGAAVTILTIAMLKNIDIDESIAVTGTINSGGIIGPIGGVKAKVEAAKGNGIKKVIIPSGERFVKENEFSNDTNATNTTIDVVEYGKNIGVDVIEAGDIDEAIFIFTGQRIKNRPENIEIDSKYIDTMKQLSLGLCNRTENLFSIVNGMKGNGNESNLTILAARNLSSRGKAAFDNHAYYSSASYCFGANVRLSYLMLLRQNLSEASLLSVAAALNDSILTLNEKINSVEIRTITDLESYMAMRERLVEAEELLGKSMDSAMQRERLYNLAYASERINSAVAWLTFLDNRGKVFNLNEALVENSCRKKIAEVDEQFQYMSTIIPIDISDIRLGIDSAYADIPEGNPELCLFKASKAKAEINTLLSSRSIDQSQADSFIEHKLKVAKWNIAEEINDGIFPVLAYSYYEYADSLKETDKYSALLYSEYALELSNLDIYFKGRQKAFVYSFERKIIVLVLAAGLGGVVLGIIATSHYLKRKKRRKKFR